MATTIEFQSAVLAKYSEQLENGFYAGRRIPPGKNIIFDEVPWSAFKIIVITFVLPKMDLFKYLIVVKFIDASFVKCLQCNGKLALVKHVTKLDSCVYQCNNKLRVNESLIKTKFCRSSRSVRSHSWFSKSHPQLNEVLSVTYFWWNGCKFSSKKKLD